ncbi:50S ribosomal protein L21 [Candidatus Gottesmanbacteria bacterium RIFCSPHIGHO2_01_FULL_46_14]|uniref:Large ribosomal subunit protein bL21 n=3 Tax=Patescibacteria group TaxID=1783273 RepID=A0A1F5ZR15_9BACT|nr:MAG: 50S ribosomal protein L21 [Candidatus Azambacteria bacterium GW2011_GWA1_44_9]OGG14774.1 MAG: 50S ribosomal protein L21 [Candidatus Gottesmanbacteria bacterium RIFCSPHIGHO2_01_FULL_46_14]OGG28707.1 MAG: 50S ribosomal protein L21 [Candidatus Gottesmanbacteria bacterium RIFCSPLOWO2_01_FULL_46_21]
MFAIVDIAGKQYKATKGAKLVVDKLDGKEGDSVKFDRVFLISDDKKTTTGNPVVKGAIVAAKILSQQKGEKIHIRRFKSKVRERRHVGFRPRETAIEIVSITVK